ncbi:unnamed protein product [Amoebophrya sp. A25]|nr:unnamed protein product [Amoebophrya sp. A25]|eukprot:GSA25T00010538001.1
MTDQSRLFSVLICAFYVLLGLNRSNYYSSKDGLHDSNPGA